MLRLEIKADVAQVVHQLDALGDDVHRDLLKLEKRTLKPAFVDFKAAVHRRSGALAAHARIGQGSGHAYVGYDDGKPVYWAVQDFGGSVPAPHSKVRGLSGAVTDVTYSRHRPGQITRRIRIKPWTAEGRWLYPSFHKNEPAMTTTFEDQVGVMAHEHGF